MKNASGSLAGMYIGLVFIGSLLYAGYAEFVSPPLEPARTFIELQALWNDGKYGVVVTYFTTFVFLLFAGLTPLAILVAVLSLFDTLTAPKVVPIPIPTGVNLSWQRDRSLVLFAIGVGLAVLSGTFFFNAVTAPAKLSFIGSSGGFALFFAIFAIPVSIALFLDAILPKKWHRGCIDSLEKETLQSGAPSGNHLIKIGEKEFTIDSQLAEKLQVTDDVALRTSQVFERVIEIKH